MRTCQRHTTLLIQKAHLNLAKQKTVHGHQNQNSHLDYTGKIESMLACILLYILLVHFSDFDIDPLISSLYTFSVIITDTLMFNTLDKY